MNATNAMREQYEKSLFVPGHRACAGCGATIAVRAILRGTGPRVIVVSPTGCLEAFGSPYASAPWGVPWVHSLFENAPAVAAGVEMALQFRGEHDVRVVVIGGDGATYDIGFGSLSGMFERGHNITYICYDNEAYMNTGSQRSGATPYRAATTTSPAGKVEKGKVRPKKDLAAIALAHGIPYVATASIAYPRDITRKVAQALQIEGPKYINVHAPCPVGWGFDPALTIEVARLGVSTGLVPLYETGPAVPFKARPIKDPAPVEGYLKLQGRFKHLFAGPEGRRWVTEIQAIADENMERMGFGRTAR